MKNIISLAIILISAPAAAAPLSAPKEASANIFIDFKIKSTLREAAGRFLVGNEQQANYVSGGELAKAVQVSKGKGLEYKKHGVIVNCLPVLEKDGKRVRTECQFEISGPGRKNADLDAWDLDTFQYQAGFTAELGKPIVLVDGPDRRVEVTLSLAP